MPFNSAIIQLRPTQERLNHLLKAAWPQISCVDWTLFGSKVLPYGDKNIKKHTGILRGGVYSYKPAVGADVQPPVGYLSDPKRSSEILAKKIWILQQSPNIKSSLQLRRPDFGEWGGAIRSSFNSFEIDGLTGQMELVDHTLLAQLKCECGTLSQDDWRELTDPSAQYIVQARKLVGMSVDQFEDLKRLIAEIVQYANRVLSRTG